MQNDFESATWASNHGEVSGAIQRLVDVLTSNWRRSRSGAATSDLSSSLCQSAPQLVAASLQKDLSRMSGANADPKDMRHIISPPGTLPKSRGQS